MLSVACFKCCAECHYAEGRFAECRGAHRINQIGWCIVQEVSNKWSLVRGQPYKTFNGRNLRIFVIS
jgi:hypothetical protein